jgi:histidinol dehydrogenase
VSSPALRIAHIGTPVAAAILHRTPIDELETDVAVAARTKHVFGTTLSPEAFVERVRIEIRTRGDGAIREISARLDEGVDGALETSQAEIVAAYKSVSAEFVADLRAAAYRIEAFHRLQPNGSWIDYGEGLGQIVRPLDRVGLYAPAGRGAYPSTVLMTAIPARVAGVREIVMCTAARNGKQRAEMLVAADIAGVHRVFKVGGAQAICAMAYGTQSVPRVDKVLGPGNVFVVLAKRRVYGAVDVDQLPGPTETLVIADDTADAPEVAADLLAQAEHDPLATSILVTTDAVLAECVATAVEEQLCTLPTGEVARASLTSRGGAVIAPDLPTAMAIANDFAPEHLCLLVRDPWSWVGEVHHAGGIFVGANSPEAAGDYVAGPSHVMPTGRTARFASPLSVTDFVKRVSVIGLSSRRLAEIGPVAARLARAEGFEAHARAVEIRLRPRER